MTDEILSLNYQVNGSDLQSAGVASSDVKKVLRKLGVSPEIIRKVAISMYEAEINMVIHANGGTIDVSISPEQIKVVLADNGPGIANIDLAMKEGYSTAPQTIREMGFGAGMGLPNIKKYADIMNITSELGKGTTVEIIVNIPQ
ncbi:MAG: ATP-binding protein [Clostridia bacterium]|nr:ATP-binding protein [Clostridia bacterium]